MKNVFRLGIAVLVFAALTLTLCAKEIVVYENDFSSADLASFEQKGNWKVENGTLTTSTGSGSAYLIYTIPTEHAGKDFQVDVDFIGHTSTGGILIGGTDADVSDFHFATPFSIGSR